MFIPFLFFPFLLFFIFTLSTFNEGTNLDAISIFRA